MDFYKKLPSRKMNATEGVFGIRNGLSLAEIQNRYFII